MRTPKLMIKTALLLLVLMLVSSCASPTPTSTVATQAEAPTAAPTHTAVPTESETEAATEAPAEPTAAATSTSTVTPTPKSTEPLYLNLTWHQHQPMYYKNEDGVYTRPWVRVHATKDYLDMPELVAVYEGMHATFNLTPILIKQLVDFTDNGAKDLYWVLAEKPADQLTDEDKTFILNRFYDANWDHIIAVHPRYQELLDLRGGTDEAAIARAIETFTDQDFRDLQIWFNLAWVDPDYLAQEPFKALVDKGKDFAEEDKQVLFDGILDLMKQVISRHKELQDEEIIEVTTTPYAHPILPLLYDNKLQLEGNPSSALPEPPYQDREWMNVHLDRSVAMYEQYFGREVRGLWPGEGAVSQEIVTMVEEAGYEYMQTGEPVLAKSIGMDTERFPRDGKGEVLDPDTLYRPYVVADKMDRHLYVFFRDWNLSDKIGFNYASMPGEEAAKDLIDNLEAIRENLADYPGPHIVTIIVDGENAWENYDNDGKEFFHSLYSQLAESETIIPITPSEYLERFPEQRSLDNLFPGAWFSANFDTWIGESEENQAWELLGKVRADMQAFGAKNNAEAFDKFLLAEGSDWFWWYGKDQDSGQDSYFDEAFRSLMKQAYEALGQQPPAELDVPIIAAPVVKPRQGMQASITPDIDGGIDKDEWKDGALYNFGADAAVKELRYGMDGETLSLAAVLPEALQANQTLTVYLDAPVANASRTMTGVEAGQKLNAPATIAWQIPAGTADVAALRFDGKAWAADGNIGKASIGEGGVIEFSLPADTLAGLKSGESAPMQLAVSGKEGLVPASGTAELQVLEFLPLTKIISIIDPAGDDHGPGTYTYPKDAVFIPGVFDLTEFDLSTDGANLVFTFKVKGPITNGWGSPNGFSVQTFDVYIDKDGGAATGLRMLLPGRNAALDADHGWDLALTVEGWNPHLYGVGSHNGVPVSQANSDWDSQIRLYVDSGKNAIVASVPVELFGEGDPAEWAYAVAVLGQEGYPSEGVERVRDVNVTAEQYKFGGAAMDRTHTRIIDLAVPEGASPTQETMLGTYSPSQADPVELQPDAFAIITMFSAQ